MFGHRFYGSRFYAPRYFGPADPALAETPTPGASSATSSERGGRKRKLFHDESQTERDARIKAERIRLGIIEPDPEIPVAAEGPGAEIAGGAATGLTPDPGLALDLAGLYAGAYLDQEIARHFWLQDEDDAVVLLLAIATLH